MGISAVCGFFIGVSVVPAHGIHFQGIYNAPFELLSSAVKYNTLPQLSSSICFSISLASAAFGVKTFSEEKLVYWHEAAAGHSKSAYYVGKVISTVPRIALSAIHYTAFLYPLATPLVSFWKLYLFNLLHFYCIYGLSTIPSMLVRREDSPSIALILCLVDGVLNGYGPPLTYVKAQKLEWLWRTSPGLWFTEAFFDENIKMLGYLYQLNDAASSLGYTLNRYGMNVGALVIIGFLYRVAAFLSLIFMDRDKQR